MFVVSTTVSHYHIIQVLILICLVNCSSPCYQYLSTFLYLSLSNIKYCRFVKAIYLLQSSVTDNYSGSNWFLAFESHDFGLACEDFYIKISHTIYLVQEFILSRKMLNSSGMNLLTFIRLINLTTVYTRSRSHVTKRRRKDDVVMNFYYLTLPPPTQKY